MSMFCITSTLALAFYDMVVVEQSETAINTILCLPTSSVHVIARVAKI
jgi:hypothetical protein